MDIMLWMMAPVILFCIGIRFLLPNIEWVETGIKATAGCAIIGLGFMFAFIGQTRDSEVLNGKVTGKEKNRVSCEHSYSCNCRSECSGSGQNRTCSTVCDTCYEHLYDFDWDVYTTVGSLEIDRINRQGTKEPPRWTAVKIGEPAAAGHSYTNYVIGSPNSLFNLKQLEADKKRLRFPTHHRVYDYYRVKHAYEAGGGVRNIEEWNEKLALMLRDVGPAKQVDLSVVFVSGQPIGYAESLERAWLGGKKNSVNIVMNLNGTAIEWVQVFTFGKSSGNEMLQVVLRDNLQQVGDVTKVDEAVAIIERDVRAHFHRPEMAKYKYLRSNIRPSTAAIVWILILEVLFLVGFTWWSVVNDIRQYHGYGYGSRQHRSQVLLDQLRKSLNINRRK